MNTLEFIATVIQAVAWPVAVVIFLLLFEKQIAALFERVHKATLQGVGELELYEDRVAQQFHVRQTATELRATGGDCQHLVLENLADETCWYLLKVANKPLTWDEHWQILQREIFAVYGAKHGPGELDDAYAMGSLNSLYRNSLGALFTWRLEGEGAEQIITIHIPSETLTAIGERVTGAAA